MTSVALGAGCNTLDENSSENEANSSPVAPVVSQFDPRRRIRELLAIPDRDRTDAEWDELNELEIQTAPGNRAGGGGQVFNNYQNNKPTGFHSKNRSKGKGKPGGGRPPQAKLNNKPPRPA